MSDNSAMPATTLDECRRESEEINRLFEALLAEMERVPPERRTGDDWGPDGAFAQKALALVAKQRELAERFQSAMAALQNEQASHSH